ncbi:MAG: biopolymer transporter ExbD [Proteobacteria bacterium]|nr:MAG: biopolymer transporter ExbD [Pseudomonadota bacterium]
MAVVTSPPLQPPQPVKPASMSTYKRALRRETRRRAVVHEAQFLNITAMLDMMTIILVFLLKSMSSSSASVPQSNDLTLAKSVLTTEAAQEGVQIIVSKSQISVEDRAVCPIPSDATHGIEAQYKKSGANDLHIVPLANALQAWRDKDKQVRAATGKDASFSEAIIVIDKDTPYRLLVEVLYTLGQTEYARHHLMVMQAPKN